MTTWPAPAASVAAGGDDAALIVGRCGSGGGQPAGAHAGHHQVEPRPAGVQRGYLVAGGDQSVGSAALRQGGQAFHLLRDPPGDAGGGKVGVVEAGEDSYGDKQGARGTRLLGLIQGLARRGQHALAAGRVHVDHPHTEGRCRAAGPGHGVGNVVPLQIQEHPAPVLVHQIDGGRPGAGEQHRPDLERPDAAGERPDQRPRLFQVGHVEADDQPLGW